MFPIAVIGFNRPQYLQRTVRALLRQRRRRSNGRTEIVSLGQIALFQDGAVNPKSGERYATDEEVEQSIASFRRLCPRGEVFQSPVNIGIAANIDRAERWVFEQLKAAAGIFFEDDLVTTPYYLQTLEAMLALALNDERIGYVACYGNHRITLEQQKEAPAAFTSLSNNWGFGLTRRQYLRSKPYVDDYLDLIKDSDYLKPNLRRVHRLLASWGVGPLLPAQDVIRAAICCRLKSIRVNTRACLGQYIGADGTHSTPRFYYLMGYRKTELYPDPIAEFEPLSDEDYDYFIARQDHWLRWSLTPQAKQWMVGLSLIERNWPEFRPVYKPSGQTSNIDPRTGQRRI